MALTASTRVTFIPDIQGSVMATLDAASGTLTKAAYLPFGENPANYSGTFRYTSRRIDPETGGSTAQPSGLYYYRARMYSPTWGRFLQADPVGYAAGPNLYAYVNNDPLNLTDPSGRCIEDACIGEAALVAACVEGGCEAAAAAAEALVAEGAEALGLTSEAATAAAPAVAPEAAAIQTPYALEAQSATAESQAALQQVQNGSTLYRTGTLGSNMTGESQYWSLENPLTNPEYASQMGAPEGNPDFVLSGQLNPGASVVTNEAPGLGVNGGGGVQVVTSPGGVGNLQFTMPYNSAVVIGGLSGGGFSGGAASSTASK
jgi:RHS repeat-associated protein